MTHGVTNTSRGTYKCAFLHFKEKVIKFELLCAGT